MKTTTLILSLIALTLSSCASGPTNIQTPSSVKIEARSSRLGASDVGTYVLLNRKLKPIDMYYRLSRYNGKWVMEGKKPGHGWTNLSCVSGCEYRNSSAAEIHKYFPADWRAHTNIACIQNVAQAFCRYSMKGDPEKKGYVAVTLVTGHPIPIFLRRVLSASHK